MPEIFQIATSGVNILPTILLGFSLLYWLTVIIGAVDIEGFDFDIDLDADGLNGLFVNALATLGLTELPITLFFSVTFLILWVIMISFTAITGVSVGFIMIPIFIGALFLGMILTRFILMPFKSLFSNSGGSSKNTKKLIGELCEPLYTLEGKKLGQARIFFNDAELLINVKSRSGEKIEKGTKCLILKKEESGNTYFVQKFDEWEEE